MSQLIQYIVVRGDLLKVQNWPLGALITQCCHAATAVNYLFRDDPVTIKYFEDLDNMHKVVLEVNFDVSYFRFILRCPRRVDICQGRKIPRLNII